jgi:hypothetical protein
MGIVSSPYSLHASPHADRKLVMEIVVCYSTMGAYGSTHGGL